MVQRADSTVSDASHRADHSGEDDFLCFVLDIPSRVLRSLYACLDLDVLAAFEVAVANLVLCLLTPCGECKQLPFFSLVHGKAAHLTAKTSLVAKARLSSAPMLGDLEIGVPGEELLTLCLALEPNLHLHRTHLRSSSIHSDDLV